MIAREGSVGARLGELLKSRNVKVSEAMSHWDANGDGKIQPKEFRLNVRKLF